MCANKWEAQPSGNSFQKYADRPVSGKDWAIGIFSLLPVHWARCCGESSLTINNCFFVCYGFVVSWMQAWLAFRVRSFGGLTLWVGVLKVGVPNVGSKSFTVQREAGIWDFPPVCMMLYQGGLYGESVSQPFLAISVWIFSHSPDVYESALQLVSGFLSEVIALCVAVYLLCLWEDGSSGASYVVILANPYPKYLFK